MLLLFLYSFFCCILVVKMIRTYISIVSRLNFYIILYSRIWKFFKINVESFSMVSVHWFRNMIWRKYIRGGDLFYLRVVWYNIYVTSGVLWVAFSVPENEIAAFIVTFRCLTWLLPTLFYNTRFYFFSFIPTQRTKLKFPFCEIIEQS